jgi:phage terminase large subunit-like protein
MRLTDFLNDLTLEDSRSYGRNLDDFQRADFDALATGIPSAYLGRPRGHSKSMDLGAYALHHIVTTPGARAYAFAVDQDQAKLIRDSVAGFVRRSPTLRANVQVFKNVISIDETDARLEVWSADAASAWGLRPSLMLLDELSMWRGDAADELFNAAFSSTGKVPGCQLLVGTTAHWNRNGLCYRIRELAREDADWYFSEIGQCATWVDAKWLQRQKAILPAHVYEMLHENVWTEAGGEFLTWAEIDGVFCDDLKSVTSPPQGGAKYFFGLDLATSRDRTALAIVRVEDKTLIVDNIITWSGTPQQRVQLGEVQETVEAFGAAFKPREIVLDPYQGLLMSERLNKHGLRVHEFPFTSTSRQRLFENLLQMIRQGTLKSFNHPLLREELSGLRWVDKGGRLRPDHPDNAHDDTVIAVALAASRAVASTIKPKHMIKARQVGRGFGSGARMRRGMGEYLNTR